MSRRLRFSPMVFFAGIIAAICGALIFFLHEYHTTPETAAEGCIILITDEWADDSRIRETLNTLGLGSFISESSQIVYLDDFGAIREIPLDSYYYEVHAFDPRNDGYADLLHSFFIRDGKRYFYLPLDDVSGLKSLALEKQIALLLENNAFELFILGEIEEKVNFIIYGFFAAACFLGFLLSRYKRNYAYKFPLILAMGILNIHAFIPSLLLCSILELIYEPVKEVSIIRYYRNKNFNYAGAGLKVYYDALIAFRKNIFAAIIFTILLPFYFYLFGFPVYFTLFILFSSLLLLYMQERAEFRQIKNNTHILFSPVLFFTKRKSIIRFLKPAFSFMLFYMLILLVFNPFYLEQSENTHDFDESVLNIIHAEDYYRHINYQRNFSYLPFGSEETSREWYYNYFLDTDGLISYEIVNITYSEEDQIFPLEDLLAFFKRYHQNSPALVNDERVRFPFFDKKYILLSGFMHDK